MAAQKSHTLAKWQADDRFSNKKRNV